MQVVLRCQSACPFGISNCMHIVPQSPAAANQKYSFAPLTPLLPQLSMHQSGSITTLHAVPPHGPRLLTQDGRSPQLSSSAGWPDFLDFSASPRKESLAAWLPGCLHLHLHTSERQSRGGHATLQRSSLCEDRIRLMTGNRHAARGPLTRAPHASGGSLAFSAIG